MKVIPLSPPDLAVVSLLVIALAGLSAAMGLGVARRILVAASRTVVQLLLIGMVLKALFATAHVGLIAVVALVMLAAAGQEVIARQTRRYSGWWGYGLGTGAMFVSSFAVAIIALAVVIGPQPWYAPQYAIPLLGMLLGNTMNGVALGLERLTQGAWQGRSIIEQRLMLGYGRSEALHDVKREAMRLGMIPVINSMAAAGLVSLPGMMTGQILAGSAPMMAVKYQILIMFLITAGTGFGIVAAVSLGARRLFDERHRLRLDRLTAVPLD